MKIVVVVESRSPASSYYADVSRRLKSAAWDHLPLDKLAIYTDVIDSEGVHVVDDSPPPGAELRLDLEQSDGTRIGQGKDTYPRTLVWPWGEESKSLQFAERTTMVDIADIPGHPPMYVPNADVVLPEHLMHDITLCDWCSHHPALAISKLEAGAS